MKIPLRSWVWLDPKRVGYLDPDLSGAAKIARVNREKQRSKAWVIRRNTADCPATVNHRCVDDRADPFIGPG